MCSLKQTYRRKVYYFKLLLYSKNNASLSVINFFSFVGHIPRTSMSGEFEINEIIIFYGYEIDFLKLVFPHLIWCCSVRSEESLLLQNNNIFI